MLMAVVPDYSTDKVDDTKGEGKKETVDFGGDVQSLANYLNNLK